MGDVPDNSAQAVIELQWVLGTNPTAVIALNPSAAQADGPQSLSRVTSTSSGEALQLVYISGNVGVIYDTSKKTQTLLRGHVSYRLCS